MDRFIVQMFVLSFFYCFLWGMEKNSAMVLQEKNEYSRLQDSINNNDYATLVSLLNIKKIQNFIQNDERVFVYALENAQAPSIIKLLLDAGINVNFRSDNGDNILHFLAKNYKILYHEDVVFPLVCRFVLLNNQERKTSDFKSIARLTNARNIDGLNPCEMIRFFIKRSVKGSHPPYRLDLAIEAYLLKRKDHEYIQYLRSMLSFFNNIKPSKKYRILLPIEEKILSPSLWVDMTCEAKKIDLALMRKIVEYRQKHGYAAYDCYANSIGPSKLLKPQPITFPSKEIVQIKEESKPVIKNSSESIDDYEHDTEEDSEEVPELCVIARYRKKVLYKKTSGSIGEKRKSIANEQGNDTKISGYTENCSVDLKKKSNIYPTKNALRLSYIKANADDLIGNDIQHNQINDIIKEFDDIIEDINENK